MKWSMHHVLIWGCMRRKILCDTDSERNRAEMCDLRIESIHTCHTKYKHPRSTTYNLTFTLVQG
jgi:hypothetical protein